MTTEQSNPDSLLTVADVAKWLCVSSSLIYQLVEAGKIPVLRIGNGRGAIRFRSEDIQSYLDECRSQQIPVQPQRKTRPQLKHIQLE
ncbi:helix-turn-helix transcriptional regulator [Neorhodopirellula pilleata]|uniref:Helix-turn-helix domain protein n=1 Tax=Neorhodopirellula pilleata TaxID=2714738 RepID=A0A5C6ABM2_9BACT|nr:helix-turn-helix domain-containing protein [Neorhodopirellula pilleata]TWT96515.1 Helix-turn-helix domain protein [Neorhodopirellula pilleata]